MKRLKILLSWLLLAGGSYFFYNGAREYFESRYSQESAANSWSAAEREAAEVDGRIVPFGPRTQSSIPAGAAFAKLSIPRLHAVVYVVEGTDDADLRRGPGRNRYEPRRTIRPLPGFLSSLHFLLLPACSATQPRTSVQWA